LKNFIIGIGGTGAKCLEHLLHCCSAGLGPKNLWAGMVDQDEANGNVSRTKILLSKYMNLRSSLHNEAGHDLAKDSNLFKTHITANNDAVWLPLKGADPTLEEVIHYELLKPEVKGLMDCLYDPDELKQNLSEGFRARPNIGAAAMLATTGNEDDPFWSQIYKAIDAARGGEEVRVFIISSIFGGTGASGFPNIARRIKQIQKEKNVTSNFHLGGALMLPYFNYDVPEENMEGELYAKPEEFLDQTKGALQYYAKLFEYDKIFDQVYVTGWDPLTKLPNFKMGGNLQNNPPLFPELYAALGALKFFSEDNKISDTQEIFHIGKNESNEILWSDVPNVSNNLNSKDNISNLIRFSFSYNWMYGPALTGSWSKIKKYENENWFKRLIFKNTYNSETKACEIGHEQNQEVILSMQEYCQDVLTWITDMQYSTIANTDQKMDLIVSDFFSEFKAKNTSTRVTIKEKLNAAEKNQFNTLINDSKNLKLLNIMSNICYKKINRDQKGLGVFMDILFRSCEQ
tara:strand:+ start:3887 stop:5431 length:1545 start_codon:yes stop_codon:yes gene_type:complete